MRIVKKKTLEAYYLIYSDAKKPLEDWYTLIKHSELKSFNDVKAVFKSADQVGKATVFNIKGNHYRLITSIHYKSQIVYILEVMTHAEYSKNRWQEQYQVFD